MSSQFAIHVNIHYGTDLMSAVLHSLTCLSVRMVNKVEKGVSPCLFTDICQLSLVREVFQRFCSSSKNKGDMKLQANGTKYLFTLINYIHFNSYIVYYSNQKQTRAYLFLLPSFPFHFPLTFSVSQKKMKKSKSCCAH